MIDLRALLASARICTINRLPVSICRFVWSECCLPQTLLLRRSTAESELGDIKNIKIASDRNGKSENARSLDRLYKTDPDFVWVEI